MTGQVRWLHLYVLQWLHYPSYSFIGEKPYDKRVNLHTPRINEIPGVLVAYTLDINLIYFDTLKSCKFVHPFSPYGATMWRETWAHDRRRGFNDGAGISDAHRGRISNRPGVMHPLLCSKCLTSLIAFQNVVFTFGTEVPSIWRQTVPSSMTFVMYNTPKSTYRHDRRYSNQCNVYWHNLF